MKFGIGVPTASEGFYVPAPFAGPREYLQLIKMAEALGFHSIWVEDRYTMPGSQRRPKEPLPNLYEPLVSLAYVAGVTQRIRLATGAIILPLREPVLLAKQVSTLDVFSGGRSFLGVGVGALRDEFLAVRPRYAKAHRGVMLEESLAALQLLLSQEKASFKGRYYEFQDVSIYPKPVQKPYPVYLSGNHPDIARRVARWCTGWMLSVSTSLETIGERIDGILPLLDAQGRDLAEIDIMAVTVLSLARTHQKAVQRFLDTRIVVRAKGQDIEEFAKRNFIGTPAEVAERIRNLQGQGTTHCLISKAAVDTFEDLREQVQWFGEEVMPEFKSL